ncbi:hypothetical protein Rxyl_0734 [Rubrobacter xylanophilus DSM 9941]|uniref:Uncharacterized protein n=1 Tax=Rubrobacter xylanophilus (strain DSM 9941 / JCM 11954 / NBRC 16129 / PRD-1) TaxID=266117 RepID=Q1AY25_RUBXD|nr:hypothetical protein [Rubrobacter xylanophilus]ABG03703.1 hypothetical protein Rxyl_0734 [Rubrobacter xylanophilus DSM 9941]
MDRRLVQSALEQAKQEKANLAIWDRRDTFTVEAEHLDDVELGDGYLRVRMQDGRATVYLELDAIYKLAVEQEGARPVGIRAGFSVGRS